MSRFAKVALAACLLACMAVVALGCAAPAASSSSSSSSKAASLSVADKKVSDGPFYALLVGNDTRYGTVDGEGLKESDPSYSDTMMLMRVDPVAHRIGILSIPRDTLITLDGHPEKINEAHHAYGMTGPNGTIDQVEALTGVRPDYYFETTFAKFETLIDALGGVKVNVPVTLEWSDIVHGGEDGEDLVVQAGDDQTLNGPEALVFARVRKQYATEGEANRQANGRQVVKSALSFVASRPASEAGTYANIVTSACKTNMSTEDLKQYIEKFSGSTIEFQTGSGPYSGGMIGDMWAVARDEGTYHELVSAMENGGDMQAIVPDPVAARG